MSKVFVIATNERCPAVSALRSERIPFELVTVSDNFTYGQTLHRLWMEGEEFITIEHDIVPWPGAIQSLFRCTHKWCIFQNMIGHSGKLQNALGVLRVSEGLTRAQSDANLGWDKTEWNHLDAQVYGALQVDRKFLPHVHYPPVAHLTDMKVIDEWVMPKEYMVQS